MPAVSARLADALDLPVEVDAELCADIRTDRLAQSLQVGGGRLAGVDQEIRVQRREHRAAERLAAPARRVHQPPRGIAGRVLEGRAAGLLADRLAGLAPG